MIRKHLLSISVIREVSDENHQIEGGVDIDIWDFEELKQVVGEFKNQTDPVVDEDLCFQEQSEASPDQNIISEVPIEESKKTKETTPVKEGGLMSSMFGGLFSNKDTESQEEKERKEELERSEKVQIEGQDQYVNVQQLSGGSLAKQHVEIDVSKVEYKPGGFMSFAYVEYTIETTPFEWKVIRRE